MGSSDAGTSASAAGSAATPAGERSHEHFPLGAVLIATEATADFTGCTHSVASGSQHDFAFGFAAGLAQHAGISASTVGVASGFAQQQPLVIFSMTGHEHESGAQPLVFASDFG